METAEMVVNGIPEIGRSSGERSTRIEAAISGPETIPRSRKVEANTWWPDYRKSRRWMVR